MSKIFKVIGNVFNILLNFFKDDTPESLTRATSAILVIAGIIFAFKYPTEYTTIGLLLGTGVGQKVGQKAIEKNK